MVGDEKFVNQVGLVMTLYREKDHYDPKLVERNVKYLQNLENISETEEKMKKALGDENLHEDMTCGRYGLDEVPVFPVMT
jgi:hypothetical protein